MDDRYYKDLIDKVQDAETKYREILYNESDMRDPIGDGFDYFTKLWNIMNDQDLNVSYETYFSSLSVCLAAFYGERQDPLPVWEHIVKRYKQILQTPEEIEPFNAVFIKFLKCVDGLIPTMDLFFELMHLAIETKNLEIAQELLWMTPTELESWGQIEDIYENDPGFAAYIECLSDIHYDTLPKDAEFKETVRNLYLAFGDNPEMEKLRNLYNLYFEEYMI